MNLLPTGTGEGLRYAGETPKAAAKLDDKARGLRVKMVTPTVFHVESGSEAGKVYKVVTPSAYTQTFRCTCKWQRYNGRDCSHARAVAWKARWLRVGETSA